MKLLKEDELQWSSVVANNSMNRERVAFGVNSYEQEIGFNPINFIEKRVSQPDISWTDLCCGSGNALYQAADYFESKKSVKKISIVGIDLVSYFSSRSTSKILELREMNLKDWEPKQTQDLITIIHGLHYIGDKINLITTAASYLKKDGLFIGNLDLNNILIKGSKIPQQVVLNLFKKNKIHYDHKKKLISIFGPQKIKTNLRYLGADDKAGPNYTGQPVVNSYYELEEEKL